MTYEFSKREFVKRVAGKYLFWVILSTAAVCGTFALAGTLAPVDLALVGGFALLIGAIILFGRTIAQTGATVKINDSKVVYSQYSGGFESFEYVARGLTYVAESVSAVELTRKGLKVCGDVTIYELHQNLSGEKNFQRKKSEFIIPCFFENQKQMQKDIENLCGR